jgi:hypothetical protein
LLLGGGIGTTGALPGTACPKFGGTEAAHTPTTTIPANTNPLRFMAQGRKSGPDALQGHANVPEDDAVLRHFGGWD